MKLQFLMPMAGRGQRFGAAHGPKPLIPVRGRPMFLVARSSVKRLLQSENSKEIYIILREDDEAHGMGDRIRAEIANAEIISLNTPTKGAAETCLGAAHLLDGEQPLLILDCDLRFSSTGFESEIRNLDQNELPYDALVSTFRAQRPQYSYVRTDEQGYGLEVAEKSVISNHAIAGAYFFTRAATFLRFAKQRVSQPVDTGDEYYLSHLLADLIASGGRLRVVETDFWESFGTPEELAHNESANKTPET